MKKIVYIFVLAVSAALLLTACNKDVRISQEELEGPQEITFAFVGDMTAGVETRGATPVTTNNLSTVYVKAVTTNNNNDVAVGGFENVSFTKPNSSVNAWTGGKFWPASNPNYRFYFTNSSSPSMTFNAGGATISPSNADTDIVVGYLSSSTFNSTNSVTLEHIFAQIGTCKVRTPEGWTVTQLRLWLQPKTSGTYNLKSAQWTSTQSSGMSDYYLIGSASTGVSVPTTGNTANTYTSSDHDLWLVPGNYTLYASYTISKDAYSVTYTGTSGNTPRKSVQVNIQQGKNNNIIPVTSGGSETPNIPEPGGANEITFSISVTDWTNNSVQAQF